MRTLTLLWRVHTGEPPRRGPRPRLELDQVVDAAIALADTEGLEAVTMRSLARRLGISAMALYTYVPGKDELLDLMLDQIYARMPHEPWAADEPWRTRLRTMAAANRALLRDHPWAAGVSTGRPPLGPGQMAKYEHELAAFDGLDLRDVEIDAALSFVLAFVRSAAVAAQDAAAINVATGDDAAWWAEVAPLLAQLVDPADYPRADRVGSAVGAAQGAAFDPDGAYAFGLERVLDGLAALIDAAGTSSTSS